MLEKSTCREVLVNNLTSNRLGQSPMLLSNENVEGTELFGNGKDKTYLQIFDHEEQRHLLLSPKTIRRARESETKGNLSMQSARQGLNIVDNVIGCWESAVAFGGQHK